MAATVPTNTNALNMLREYLASAVALNGSYYDYQADYAKYLQSLPRHVDDVERDFGLDIYHKMLNDSAVSSALGAIKTQVLSAGVKLTGRVTEPASFNEDPKQQAEYDKSEAVRALCEDMLDGLQQPIEAILMEMMDCLPYGNSLAEATYESRGGKLWLKTLRVKPRHRYAFVVNDFLDCPGVVPSEIGWGMYGTQAPESMIPREKFFLLSFNARGNDPRGHSILRPAYNWWYLKQQITPDYLKYLKQYATPSIAGFLPPNAGDVQTGGYNPDGTPATISAAEAMLAQLITFANSTALVLENESKIQQVEMSGTGEAYLQAFDFFDRQIIRAILFNARAVMEAEHGSKADSGAAGDILGAFVAYLRRMVETAFFQDVLIPIVTYNFGEADAKLYTPTLVLSDVQQEDLLAYGEMIAKLWNAGFLHTSQQAGIDAKLNLPERDMETQQLDALQAQEDAKAKAQNLAAALNPGGLPRPPDMVHANRLPPELPPPKP